MKTSVASVTFRNKRIAEVAELARRAGLDAIEWGGDVHVPPGDLEAAQTALRLAESLGADAVVGLRYASSSVMQGAAEVVAYGTAVKFL